MLIHFCLAKGKRMERKEEKINWYTRTVKDITQYFNVDTSRGLSSKWNIIGTDTHFLR